MRKLKSENRVTNSIPRKGQLAIPTALAWSLMLSNAFAQPKPTGIAAHESLLTTLFFALLAAFVALVAWEVIDNRKASRSSLDIAKLAAAAAKKQSAAGAPSGSLPNLDAPPTTRPFAPPPPPPPPKPSTEPPSAELPSPFAPPPSQEVHNPFAAPPAEMLGATPHSMESTVAFSPMNDAGSSGGWADLLQRVRAGEPEAASFKDSGPPPLTEGDSSFVMPPGGPDLEAGGLSPASSSEAWEALLKRTTTGDPLKSAPKAPVGDVGKISLNSNFQLPGEPAAPPAYVMPSTAFGLPATPEEPSAPGTSNVFGNLEDSGATFPAPGFSMPPSPATEPLSPGMGFSFSTDPTSEASSSPFGGLGGGGFGTSGGFGAPPPPAFGTSPTAGSSGGFESPTFKLPGSPPTEDFGGGASGGFQLPGGGGGGFGGGANNPFDFGGSGSESPSSSTLPLSDLFSKPGGSAPPSFQLPSGGGGMDFGSGLDNDVGGGSPGLGRTISLDFAKGAGQKPPPPLPKTEG